MPLFPTPKDLCKHELKEFMGHKDEVNSVSFSSDFLFAVTGSDDERVRLFNVKTKECVIKLKGHEGAIKSVAVSPCDKFFASGSFDKTARIWRTSDGICLQVLKGHTKSVEVVAFSPGSAYLCTGSWDRTAILWCVQTGCHITTLNGHESLVQSVAFSNNFEFMVTGSWDFTVRVWTLNHSAYRAIISKHRRETHGKDKNFYHYTRSRHEGSLQDERDDVDVSNNYVESDPDEMEDTVDNADGNESEEERPVEKMFDAYGGGINIQKSGSNDCEGGISVEEITEYRVLIGHCGNVHSVAFSKIGMLASGSWDRTIRLWNPWNGNLLRLLEGHTGWVKAVTFSHDSIFVASAADDDSVKVWDIPSGECINTLEGNTDLAQYCAFTANGLLVASGAAVSKIKRVPKNKEEEEADGEGENAAGQVMALLHQ